MVWSYVGIELYSVGHNGFRFSFNYFGSMILVVSHKPRLDCGIRWVCLRHERKFFRCWKIPRFSWTLIGLWNKMGPFMPYEEIFQMLKNSKICLPYQVSLLVMFNRNINLWLILGDPNYAIRGNMNRMTVVSPLKLFTGHLLSWCLSCFALV